MSTSIVVLAFNRIDLTVPCVDSILANTDPDLYDLVVYDNGSTDGTAAIIAGKGVKVESTFPNIGFSRGNNNAANHVTTDNLLFLNNDPKTR